MNHDIPRYIMKRDETCALAGATPTRLCCQLEGVQTRGFLRTTRGGIPPNRVCCRLDMCHDVSFRQFISFYVETLLHSFCTYLYVAFKQTKDNDE